MTRLDDRDGIPVWRQIRPRGERFDMMVIESEPPRRLKGRVVDNRQFGGTWTWRIDSIGDDRASCAVTITEDGEIYNPVFRSISRLMEMRATMDRYHTALARALGVALHFDGTDAPAR
jgi:hypothetical protein